MTDTSPPRRGDAFLLGYLPHQVRAHFAALAVLDEAGPGAEGELAARLAEEIRALPLRGPEVVSSVWQVEGLVGKLGAKLPAPPRTAEDEMTWRMALGAIVDERWPDAAAADGFRASHNLGARAGGAETLVGGAARLFGLLAAAPGHAGLLAAAAELRARLEQAAGMASPSTRTPTAEAEEAAIGRELGAAAAAMARGASDEIAGQLEQIRDRLRVSTRVLEAAAWGTPREGVAAWRDKTMTGNELLRRIAEHQRWIVPCRVIDGRPEPRIFVFDKKVLFAFSDGQAMTERPAFLREKSPDGAVYLTLPGTAILSWVPDDEIDVLVLDATDDPEAPGTINYPREMHGRLRQVAGDVATELAAADWSHLDLEALRRHSFWILVGPGDMMKNLLDPDVHGRVRAGLFTTEAALDAHLARATPAQTAAFAECQKLLLPGSSLFPALAGLDIAGIVMNPSGPGRTRAFNKKTVEMLSASAGPA